MISMEEIESCVREVELTVRNLKWDLKYRAEEHATTVDVLEQVLKNLQSDSLYADDKLSFARHKLSFLLDWLKNREKES